MIRNPILQPATRSVAPATRTGEAGRPHPSEDLAAFHRPEGRFRTATTRPAFVPGRARSLGASQSHGAAPTSRRAPAQAASGPAALTVTVTVGGPGLQQSALWLIGTEAPTRNLLDLTKVAFDFKMSLSHGCQCRNLKVQIFKPLQASSYRRPQSVSESSVGGRGHQWY